jgi:hypothetical protein
MSPDRDYHVLLIADHPICYMPSVALGPEVVRGIDWIAFPHLEHCRVPSGLLLPQLGHRMILPGLVLFPVVRVLGCGKLEA